MSDNEETTVARGHPEIAGSGVRRPVLLVLSGRSLGRSRALDKKACVIGRSQEADLVLDDEGVSRKHAKVVLLSEDVLMIKDLESTNGTFVNGLQIETHPLMDGDRIRIGGNVTLKFGFEDEIESDVRQHLFEAATRDALTDVFNKRAFDDELVRAVAFAKRHKQPLSLLVFDLDHFKQVNDVHGHPAGDRVLQEMTRSLSRVLRLEDVLARIGGEEFAVLLTGIDEARACQAADRIRRAAARLLVDLPAAQLQVTISVGVAQFDPAAHATPADLIAAADARLYEAKESGRNRVCPAPPRRRPEESATVRDPSLLESRGSGFDQE